MNKRTNGSHPPLPPATKSPSSTKSSQVNLPKGFRSTPSFAKHDDHIAVPLTPANTISSSTSSQRSSPQTRRPTPASLLFGGAATPTSTKSPATARFPSFEAYDHEGSSSPVVRIRQEKNVSDKNPQSNPNAPPSLRKRQKKVILLICSILVLLTGSFDGILGKLMNKQVVPKCDPTFCQPQYFQGPFFQSFLMYLGELLVLGYFLTWKLWLRYREYHKAKKAARRSNSIGPAVFRADEGLGSPTISGVPRTPAGFMDGSTLDGSQTDLAEISLRDSKSFECIDGRPHCPYYMWSIPMLLDYTSAVLINQALLMAPASTVQMLRSFSVVITALFSFFYLRVPIKVHQLFGILLVTSGMICASIFYFTKPDNETNFDSTSSWIGILLTIIGTTLTSSVFVVQERLMRKYECNPLEGVGMMGLFGSAFGLVALSIVNLAKIEVFDETIYMMTVGFQHHEYYSQSLAILLGAIFFALSVSIFNSTALTVTTLGSALLCTVLFTSRTAVIWLVELALGWSPFDVYNLVGVILISIAILVYNYNYMKGIDDEVQERVPTVDGASSCGGRLDDFLFKPLHCGMKQRMKREVIDQDDGLGVVTMKPLSDFAKGTTPTHKQHSQQEFQDGTLSDKKVEDDMNP